MRIASLIFPLLAATLSCSPGGNHPRGGADDAGASVDMPIQGGGDGFGACGTSTFEAKQAEAAMLVILDRSVSMSDNNKFGSAANAIVQALDQSVFDTMWVGLYATPSGPTHAPQCLIEASFGIVTEVDCANKPFPQVDLAQAGAKKSIDPGSLRNMIKSTMNNLLPGDNGDPDSTPMYGAIQNGISDLQGWPKMGKRMLLIVTDGSWSCTSLSNRVGLMDANGCPDWEDPQGVIALLSKANKDAMAPIDTFIVGVPGADTYDATGSAFPQYHMRMALSAMAYAGSPTHVPANCTGKTYAQNAPDPAVSCHFDMTQGNFSSKVLADAISNIRGKVLGCTFDLPTPDAGTVNMDEVNVTLTVSGQDQPLYRRKDMNNTCANDGCWDYDANGKVILVGKACDQVQNGTEVKVQIVVGCATIIG